MGVRTNQRGTLNVLDAHMNARCEDDNCETCPLRLTMFNENTDYCYALTLFAEMFFLDSGTREGEKYADNYYEKFKQEFKERFKIA